MVKAAPKVAAVFFRQMGEPSVGRVNEAMVFQEVILWLGLHHSRQLVDAVRSQLVPSAASCWLCLIHHRSTTWLPQAWTQHYQELTGVDVLLCPECRIGRLVPIQLLPAPSSRWTQAVEGDSP